MNQMPTEYTNDTKQDATLTDNGHPLFISQPDLIRRQGTVINNIGTTGGTVAVDKIAVKMRNISGRTIMEGECVVFGSQAQNVPANGDLPESASVVSRWKLEEASGDATDAVSTNTLTDTNTVGSSTDVAVNGFANSRLFVRTSSERFEINDNAALSITGSFTISAWIKPTGTTFSEVASKFEESGDQRSYRIAHDTGLYGSVSGAGTTSVEINGGSITTNSWQHIILVYEASTRLELYKDGVSVATNTVSIPASVFNSTADFVLGADDTNSTPANFFDGSMQDVIIWNAALTDSQIETLYNLYFLGNLTLTGDEINLTTTSGNDRVAGMAFENILDEQYGTILFEGITTKLKVNGTADIAIGDFLTTYTEAGIATKAVTGDMIFAIARESYTTNDSNGVIDALLIGPRKI